MIKIKTDDVNRWGKSLHLTTGIISFDKEGFSELSENHLDILIKRDVTDPYPVENFTPTKEGEVKIDSDSENDEEIELTKESIQKMKMKDLKLIAESQNFNKTEWESLSEYKLKKYLTDKFFAEEAE